jgi:hypothetical protein
MREQRGLGNSLPKGERIASATLMPYAPACSWGGERETLSVGRGQGEGEGTALSPIALQYWQATLAFNNFDADQPIYYLTKGGKEPPIILMFYS